MVAYVANTTGAKARRRACPPGRIGDAEKRRARGPRAGLPARLVL